MDHMKDANVVDMTNTVRGSVEESGQWKQVGCDEKRKVAVHAEIERVYRLPSNSSYATHRMRVLNKILQLMSIQRTHTQDEELELLFAGLSL